MLGLHWVEGWLARMMSCQLREVSPKGCWMEGFQERGRFSGSEYMVTFITVPREAAKSVDCKTYVDQKTIFLIVTRPAKNQLTIGGDSQ